MTKGTSPDKAGIGACRMEAVVHGTLFSSDKYLSWCPYVTDTILTLAREESLTTPLVLGGST